MKISRSRRAVVDAQTKDQDSASPTRAQRRAERDAERAARYATRKTGRAAQGAERTAARAARHAGQEAARAERELQRGRVRAERRAAQIAARTRRDAERAKQRAPELDARERIKAWLTTLDATLRAIEKTAWRARTLGEEARSKVEVLSGWKTRLGRLADSGLVLARVGCGYRLHTTKAAFVSSERAALDREALHEDSARRLYELSLRQGGAFLKLGQMLSSRPDLLPAAYVRELSKLQDAAPPVAFNHIVTTLERELGKSVSEAFAELDPQPLASASIGQVHRARLHDGREVAVKVQRPDIDVLVKLDMELLEVFVRALAEGLPPLDFDTIIRETRAMVSAELDYGREAELTARMADFFRDAPQIAVPYVVRELSTERVLVTTFMPGEKITHVLDRLLDARDGGDAQAHTQLTSLLATVFEAYARQVLEAGVFQADPHPGNLLAHVSAQATSLTVLDFGCAKQLSAAERGSLIALLRGVMLRDVVQLAEAMEALGFRSRSGTRAGLEAYADAALRQLALVKREGGGFADQLEMVSRLADFGRFIESDPIVQLPEAFVMLGRVFGTLAGLFVHYRPDASATASVLPVVLAALAGSAPAVRAA